MTCHHPAPASAAPEHWRSTLPPAEASTEVGLDLDDDGALWYPAPAATVVRPLAVVLVLLAGTAALIFGPDWLGHWMASTGAAR